MHRTVPVIVVAFALAAACSSPPHPAVIRTRAIPTAFHIVYRADDYASGNHTQSTVRWWVHRPFDGRREVRTGPPPGGKLLAVTVTALGRSLTQNGDTEPLVLDVPPQPAVADVRFDLLPTTSDGAVTRGRTRTVAGRPCQTYRMSPTVAGGGALGGRPTSRDYSELCVDGSYLVLQRTDVVGGKKVHVEQAVSVETGDRGMSADLFASPAQTVDLQHGGGSFRPVDPASRPPGTFYELPAPPSGFTLQGRYAVVPPQPENFRTADPTTRAARVAGVVDVYVRGPDLIVVDRGATLGGVAPFAAEPRAQSIDVGSLGTGELIRSLLYANARVAMSNGHYLRVVGTVAPNQLVDLLRQLQPQPGGELTYLDGP